MARTLSQDAQDSQDSQDSQRTQASANAAVDRCVLEHGVLEHGALEHGVLEHGALEHGVLEHGVLEHGVFERGAPEHGVFERGAPEHGVFEHGAPERGASDHSAPNPATRRRLLHAPRETEAEGPGSKTTRSAQRRSSKHRSSQQSSSHHNFGAPTRGDAARLLLLTTGAPGDVLARLSDGDPLGLAARLVRRAAARALLVSPWRLFALGVAHCARRSREYRGRPQPHLWLERRAEEVVRGIERGARTSAFDRASPRHTGATQERAAPVRQRSADGATTTAVRADTDLALERAASRFNTCSRADREALWRLAFAGSTLDELARECGASLTEVARRARRALDALLSEPRFELVSGRVNRERSLDAGKVQL